jgi:hypothetical protein
MIRVGVPIYFSKHEISMNSVQKPVTDSVADPDPFFDPDPAFHFDTDPDPTV